MASVYKGKTIKSWWYGIEGIEFIYHNEWTDAELRYKGVLINSHDIEDTMWSFYQDEGYDDTDIEKFADYMKENESAVKELCELSIAQKGA